MADCPRPLKTCTATVVTEASQKECREWTCCLPWGASLTYKDGCLEYAEGNPPADGEYGSITVVDGCIVDASPAEVASYRGDPCAPVPCPCDSSDDDGGSNVCNPSTTSGNLYDCDMTGKPLVKCYVKGGSDNVTVTGSGTSTNPFVITVTVDEGITNVSTHTGSVITTSTASTSSGIVAYVDHAEGWNDQIINGMSFDKYGHLTGYSETSSSGINGVVGTNGVTATTDNSSKIVTVELEDPATVLKGDYQLGGYNVTLDAKNRITKIGQTIALTESTKQWGAQQVTYNEYGSLSEVVEQGTTGTFIHAILPAPEDTSVVQRTVTFSLLHTTALMVEIMGMGGQAWLELLTVKLDNGTLADAALLAGTSDSGVFVARYMASGIWAIGEHTLKISNRSGFDTDSDLSVSIIPVQSVTGYTDDTSVG